MKHLIALAAFVLSFPALAATSFTNAPGSGAVFLDETLHGFARAPSFWRETLSFPLGLVTIHALLLAGDSSWGSSRNEPTPIGSESVTVANRPTTERGIPPEAPVTALAVAM